MQEHVLPGQPPFTHELHAIGAHGAGTFTTKLVWWIPERRVEDRIVGWSTVVASHRDAAL